IPKRIGKGGASCAESQSASAAGTVHFLQRGANGGKFAKIKSFFQVIGRIVLNIMAQPAEVQDGIQAVPAHHFFEGFYGDQTEFIGIIQTGFFKGAHSYSTRSTSP